MKYFFVVGEKSGDNHAADLCSELFKIDTEAEILAWGGEKMEAVGVKIKKNYQDLAFMGFWEVLKNISKIYGFFKEVKKEILGFQPDVIILVDYAGFNLRVAKWAKTNHFKTAYYIAPKAWAWNESRVFKLKKYIDELLVILPFEEQYFKKFGIKTTYVGNPSFQKVIEFKKNHPPQSETNKTIALLPGSRKQEVEKMLETMVSIVKDYPEYRYVVAGIKHLPKEVYESIKQKMQIEFENSFDILNKAHLAIVTSGTATLEACLFGVPQVVVYKTSTISFYIAKFLIKVPYISLVNLIANKSIVPELIQEDYTANNLKNEINKLSSQNISYKNQLKEYQEIYDLLGSKKPEIIGSKIIYNLSIS